MKDELLEKTMEAVCDLCKWPYMESAGYLKDHCDHCDHCPAEAAIMKVLQKGECDI